MENEISAYLDQHQAATVTLWLERRWLGFFGLFCQRQGLRWQDCTLQQLRAFHQELLWMPARGGRLYATNTLDSILRTVRAFYRWAHRTQRLAVDPTVKWSLPRTPAVEKRSLTKAQVLHILNLPDLSKPIGQRNQVFLELLYYQRLSVRQCLKLTIHELGDLDEAIQPNLKLYLEQGRLQLSRDDHPQLLLSNRGGPIKTFVGLELILRKYSPNEAPPLTARILHRSYLEHQEQLTGRRLLPNG